MSKWADMFGTAIRWECGPSNICASFSFLNGKVSRSFGYAGKEQFLFCSDQTTKRVICGTLTAFELNRALELSISFQSTWIVFNFSISSKQNPFWKYPVPYHHRFGSRKRKLNLIEFFFNRQRFCFFSRECGATVFRNKKKIFCFQQLSVYCL